MKKKGTLYLIPCPIAEGTTEKVIGEYVKEILRPIRFFLVEDIRSARRYLSILGIYPRIEELYFSILDKNTAEAALAQLMSPLEEGKPVGVIAESGCPGIADPGALAVRYAHTHGISVEPLVGPSSILLALMASGLNGQRFAFHGYLPVEAHEASGAIKELEKESRKKGQTQLFIETPYRNNALLAHLLKALSEDTLLCVAQDITGPHSMIRTQPVKKWRAEAPRLLREPAMFLFLAR